MPRRARPPLFLGLVLLLVSGCGEEVVPPGETPAPRPRGIAAAKARGTLRVALEPEFKPFEYIDARGELVGFDVDLARLLGERLGVRVEFVRVRWESIIPTLEVEDADIIISGMTATPERAERVAYSEPYFHTITCLLCSKARAAGITRIEDLDEVTRRVVVKQGTTGDTAARRILEHAEVTSYPTENAAALEVAQGSADAFLYDLASILAHHEKHPDTTFVIRTPVSREPYAIACRKGDTASVAWLDEALAALRADGKLKELYAKHGLADPEDAAR